MANYLETQYPGLIHSYWEGKRLTAQNPVEAMMIWSAMADGMVQEVIVYHNLPVDLAITQFRKLGKLRRYNLLPEEYKSCFEAIYHLRNQAIYASHAQTACAHIQRLLGWFEQVMQLPAHFKFKPNWFTFAFGIDFRVFSSTVTIGFLAVVLLGTLLLAIYTYLGAGAGTAAFWVLVFLLMRIRKKRGSFGIAKLGEAHAVWENKIREKCGL